jgi:hypothetical protein
MSFAFPEKNIPDGRGIMKITEAVILWCIMEQHRNFERSQSLLMASKYFVNEFFINFLNYL